MRKYLLLLAAAALLAVTKPAQAYRVNIDPAQTTVINGDTNNNGVADKGETFTIVNGGFVQGSYIQECPDDPVIGNNPAHINDLFLYRFDINGVVNDVTGTDVTYGGTYRIWYNDPSGPINVSTGLFDAMAMYSGGAAAAFTGTLTEQAGPANPAFADLGPQAFIQDGTYTSAGRTGTLAGVVTRPCGVIPEPGTLSLLGFGLLPLIRRRRK